MCAVDAYVTALDRVAEKQSIRLRNADRLEVLRA